MQIRTIKVNSMFVKNKSIIAIFILLLIVLFAFSIRSFPYLFHDYDYVVGPDAGVYQYLFSKYLNSESWPVPSAYPSLENYEKSVRIWMEPGFFVFNAIFGKIIGISTTSMFQYFLPFQVSLMFIFLMFIIGRDIISKIGNHQPIGGLIAALFFAVSPFQYLILNECLYKQIYGIFILLLAIYLLQKFKETNELKFLLCSTLFGASLIAYHRPEVLVLWFVYLYCTFHSIILKHYRIVKLIILSGFLMLCVSSIIWIPNLEWNFRIIRDSVVASITEAGGDIGGAIPRVLKSYSHPFIGYFLYLPVISILAFLGLVRILKDNKQFNNLFVVSTIFLFVVIMLKLIYYGRFFYLFDILMLLFASVGLLILKNLFNKNNSKKTFCTSLSFIVIILVCSATLYQSQISPYISYKSRDTDYIKNNINKNNSLIFAPFWLSTILKSEGYRVAYYEDSAQSHLLTYSVFHIEGLYILYNFDISNIEKKYYLDNVKNIYFMWGKWDETHAEPPFFKKISAEECVNNDHLKLIYSGDNIKICQYEIKNLYKN